MRTGGPSSNAGRIDSRGGTVRQQEYQAAAVAPHGTTVRATYTVPSGVRALLAHCYTAMVVDVVQTAIGNADIRVNVQPSGGAARPVVGNLAGLPLAVGSAAGKAASPQWVMFTGDIATIETEDAATGGSKRYQGHALVYEFAP